MKDFTGKQILILDDDASIRQSLDCYFEDLGFDTTLAQSGEQALDLFAQKNFDAAIVDLRLPGITGDQFILKAHKINPHTAFIIYTGSANFILNKELENAGVLHENIFSKPVSDLQLFEQALEKLLSEDK